MAISVPEYEVVPKLPWSEPTKLEPSAGLKSTMIPFVTPRPESVVLPYKESVALSIVLLPIEEVLKP